MKKTPNSSRASGASLLRSALLLFSLSALLCLTAQAVAPQIVNLRASPVSAGQSLDIIAEVSDPDGDLDYIIFKIKGPNDADFQQIGRINFEPPVLRVYPSMSYAVGNVYGLYKIQAIAYDITTNTTTEVGTEVYTSSYTIPPLTINSGDSRLITSTGELLTTASTNGAPTTEVRSGGNLILWAGGRVTLKAGFHAKPGSFFWAAIDHNGDGYSDLEEQEDSDGDGMFDAWEVDHGLDMRDNDAALDKDNDGWTNLQEFQARTNPNDPPTSSGPPGGYQPIGPPTAPGGYHVILKLPTLYLGYNQTQGTLTPVSAP